MSEQKLTPMQEQYYNIKKNYPDAVVLFRLGDFYEGFGDDAKTMSKVLGLTLTSRDKKNHLAMAGVPHHAMAQYMPKLVDAGYKVVIVDQVENPAESKGIVKREVTKVITPGTLMTDDKAQVIDNRYIAAVYPDKKRLALAYTDLATGEMRVTEFNDDDSGKQQLSDEVKRLTPKQLILPQGSEIKVDSYLEYLEEYCFNAKDALAKIYSLLSIKSLDGLGLSDFTAGISAIGGLLTYLKETQKSDLKHIVNILPYSISDKMLLDPSSIRNLEIFYSTRGEQQYSLFNVLNKTSTGMGARLLRNLLLKPFIDKKTIINRLNSVESIVAEEQLLDKLTEKLEQIYDVQRLAGKIALNSINPKDFISLKISLEQSKELISILSIIKDNLLSSYRERLDSDFSQLNDLISSIENTINPEASINFADGNVIKSGVNTEIDELREAMVNGKDWIKNLEMQEKERTGISSLKVKFNKVFGYYIEISHANANKVPEDYIRKQTLVNAERYITPDLKDVERKVLGAEEKLIELEIQIFNEFRETSKKYLRELQSLSEVIANLDVLNSFAYSARYNNYVKPTVYDYDEKTGLIDVKAARHPVVEHIEGSSNYIPNDIYLDNQNEQLIILTGPNMAGKSTYIRQVALISLMTQVGCFVPASSAEVTLVDRIFTRVGASDNLSAGQSTFMVEMSEAANIANNATKNSLIILDEVGRGTSTYDGVSIAWALAEYLHDQVGAKTLFATHYHELVDLENRFDRIINYNVQVSEKDDEVLFLRTVAKGGTDKSYGIYVAKLSGMPTKVIERAKEILGHLQEERGGKRVGEPQAKLIIQQSMFMDDGNSEIVDEIKDLDVDSLSPKEALEKLYEIKSKIK